MKPFVWVAFGLVGGMMIWAYAKDLPTASDETARLAQSHRTVEKGAVFSLILRTALSSEHSRAGDPVVTALEADVIQDGKVILEKGTEVYGEVTRAVPATQSGDKKGGLSFVLNEIEAPGGRIPIDLSILSSYRKDSQVDKTARTRTQLAGAGIGSLLGANMAANEDKNRLKGALLGGAAGLAVGSLIAQQQGVDVEIPGGSRIKARVDRGISVE